MRTNFIFIRQAGPRSYTAEVRSLHCTKTRSTSTLLAFLTTRAVLRGETIEVKLPFVDMHVPAGLVFKLFGFETIEEICDFIRQHCNFWDEEFADLTRRSLDHALLKRSRASLIEYLGREGTKEATTQRRTRYIDGRLKH